jgi:hypothetical protein
MFAGTTRFVRLEEQCDHAAAREATRRLWASVKGLEAGLSG